MQNSKRGGKRLLKKTYKQGISLLVALPAAGILHGIPVRRRGFFSRPCAGGRADRTEGGDLGGNQADRA